MKTFNLLLTLSFLFFISHVLSSPSISGFLPREIIKIIKSRNNDIYGFDEFVPLSYISPAVEFRISQYDFPSAAIVAICEKDNVAVNVLCHYLFDEQTFNALITDEAELIRRLLAMIDDVDRVDQYGCTMLHYAAVSGRSDIVQMLLDLKYDVHKQNSNGRTPLMSALASYHDKSEEAAETLLCQMDNVDQADKQGYTAMHYAAMHGLLGIVALLLTKTKLVDVQNKKGLTPSALAAKFGKDAVVQLISNWAR